MYVALNKLAVIILECIRDITNCSSRSVDYKYILMNIVGKNVLKICI